MLGPHERPHIKRGHSERKLPEAGSLFRRITIDIGLIGGVYVRPDKNSHIRKQQSGCSLGSFDLRQRRSGFVRPHVFRRGSISLLSILLVGSVLRQASATALVAVKTPTEVVIGADSLAIISFPGSGPRRIPFCKIRRIGSIVFR